MQSDFSPNVKIKAVGGGVRGFYHSVAGEQDQEWM